MIKKACVILVFFIVILVSWATFTVYTYSPASSTLTLTLPQHLKDTIIATEDDYFHSHFGISLRSTYLAFARNLKSGSIRFGGSTITQQLMKNLFLSKERTIRRKILEATLAIIFEIRFSKEEILSQYLSIVDFGMGQVGIQGATDFYFQKVPSDITIVESAFLAGIISNPPRKFLLQDQIIKATSIGLFRLNNLFSFRYELPRVTRAQVLRMVIPYSGPYERGAYATIPPVIFGVKLFYYTDLSNARGRNAVNPALRDAFIEFVLDAKDLFGITAVENMGVFNDRLQTNSSDYLSSHAYGRAIDISAFQYHNAIKSPVIEHDETLIPIITLAQKYFDIVLTPFNDPISHNNHIHAEVLPRISCYCSDFIWILGSPAWRWCRKDFRLRNESNYSCKVCI
jgi:hypothetical protein